MTDRHVWVDYAKAIGIILVVYGHVARGIFNAGIPVNENLFRLADGIVYSFHMPLFFFLSGLFFYGSLKRRGVNGLISNKVDTIVYPYLIWSVLQGISEAYLSSYTNGAVSYSEVFSLLWMPRAQFWFLYALFMVFVAASIVFSRVSNKYLLPVLAGSMLLYIFQDSMPSYFHLNFITNNFVFFVFGILLNKWSDSEILNANKLLPISAIGFLLLQYVFHYSLLNLPYSHKGALSLLVALISILFVVALSKQLANKSLRWLQAVGSASMAIYVMHIFATSGIRIVLMKFFAVNTASIHIVVGCIVGVIAPLAALYLIRKFKLNFLLSMPISQFVCDFYNQARKKR